MPRNARRTRNACFCVGAPGGPASRPVEKGRVCCTLDAPIRSAIKTPLRVSRAAYFRTRLAWFAAPFHSDRADADWTLRCSADVRDKLGKHEAPWYACWKRIKRPRGDWNPQQSNPLALFFPPPPLSSGPLLALSPHTNCAQLSAAPRFFTRLPVPLVSFLPFVSSCFYAHSDLCYRPVMPTQ